MAQDVQQAQQRAPHPASIPLQKEASDPGQPQRSFRDSAGTRTNPPHTRTQKPRSQITKASHGRGAVQSPPGRMMRARRTSASLLRSFAGGRKLLKQGGILCGYISGYSRDSPAHFLFVLFSDDLRFRGLDKWPKEPMLRPREEAPGEFLSGPAPSKPQKR